MKAEAALRESEENYRSVFNATSDALIVFDLEAGRMIDANEAMLKLYGLASKEEALASTAADFSANEPPFTHAEARRHLQRAIENGLETYEWRARRKTGELFWAEIATRCFERNGHHLLIASVRDVTERKHNEEELRRSESRLAAAQAHARIGSWELQAGSVVASWSRQMFHLFKLDPAPQAPSFDEFLELVHPEDRDAVRRAQEQALMSSDSVSVEYRTHPANGPVRVMSANALAHRDATGRLLHTAGTVQDITERKQLESQYLRVQRLESVGTLASGVAHDLNNILSPILMGVELLLSHTADEDDRVVLTMIKDSAQRGVDTVKQLLTFARGTEAQKGPVQPRHLLKEISRLLQQTYPKNVQVYADYSGQPHTVLADASQLHQVLMNLCINARDAMPEGGVLGITLENRTFDDTSVLPHPKARPIRYVVFKVSDSGTGIPPEILDRIFDPFFTTKPQGKGTGLGLATVLGIVENHGGFVTVESEVGRGTTFQVFLPASVSAEPGADEAEKAATPQGQGELVLVVDDEPAILHFAAQILHQGGYVTQHATNASEALHICEQRQDHLRAVITDMMMPFSDGRQFITMLHQKNPALPIIAMSGLTTSEFREETMQRGARAFVCKPFTAEELLRRLADVLRKDPS